MNKKTNSINMCMCIMLLLTVGHYFNEKIILIASFFAIIMIIGIADLENKFKMVTFFSVSSGALKVTSESFSFMTLIIPFFLFNILIIKKKDLKINKSLMLISTILIAYLLLVNLVNSLPLTNSFISFIIMLLFILVIDGMNVKNSNYEEIFKFFIMGVIISNISALILYNQPHMSAFFKHSAWYEEYSRFTGFNYDPNFNSLQILLAITLYLVIFDNKIKSNVRNNYLKDFFLLLILFWLGMKSLSKMYIILTAGVFCIYFLMYLSSKEKIDKKVIIFIGFIGLLLVVLNTGIFENQINAYTNRFSGVYSINELTTGRFDIQINYLSYITSDIKKTIFGLGFDSNNRLNNIASHNTYIQIIYQIGTLGTIILAMYLLILNKCFKIKTKLSIRTKIVSALPLMVLLGGMMALDYLFSDIIFYYLILVLLGLNYSAKIKEGCYYDKNIDS